MTRTGQSSGTDRGLLQYCTIFLSRSRRVLDIDAGRNLVRCVSDSDNLNFTDLTLRPYFHLGVHPPLYLVVCVCEMIFMTGR